MYVNNGKQVSSGGTSTLYHEVEAETLTVNDVQVSAPEGEPETSTALEDLVSKQELCASCEKEITENSSVHVAKFLNDKVSGVSCSEAMAFYVAIHIIFFLLMSKKLQIVTHRQM